MRIIPRQPSRDTGNAPLHRWVSTNRLKTTLFVLLAAAVLAVPVWLVSAAATNAWRKPRPIAPPSTSHSVGTGTNVKTAPGRGANSWLGVTNTLIVKPGDLQGWVDFDDSPGTGAGSFGFVDGPVTAPLGDGSAFLTVDASGRHAVGTLAYIGTRMDAITELKYSSYQNNNTNTAAAISLQFDIDYDLNDAVNSYMGRLVFEPYISNTVQQGVWQNWDARAGKWWGSRTTVTVNGASGVTQPCQQATPCTWAEVLSLFPNAGIGNTPARALLFKAGGPVGAGGFNGNVDDFSIIVNSTATTYDFEPIPHTLVVVDPNNQQGWVDFDDSPGTGTGSFGFAAGPLTAPLGDGSAFLTVDASGRHAVRTLAYIGTRMDAITELKYSSYQNNNTNTAAAISLQFDVDYDLNDADNTYMGRLVFEPYIDNTVQQGVWQSWDARAGKWWGSRTTVTVNSVSGVTQPCQQATPCSWNDVLSLFPNAGIGNTPARALLFKAGGPVGPGGFNGNVDAFSITVNATAKTYDFDPTPHLSINDVSHNEGNSGTTSYDFTVTLSHPTDANVTVDWATANDSAVAPGDFTAISTTQLVFNPGETTKPVSVAVNGDATTESDEQFFVNLSNAANATITDSQGVGTIVNEDAPPVFTIDDVSHLEGNPPGTTAYVFTVTKNGTTAFNSSVQFQTMDGAATVADNDYVSNSGTLNFGPSDPTMQITVQVNRDFKPESDEAFTVHLSGEVGATIGDADGTATIQNDDVQPTVVYVDDDFTGPIGSDPAGPATAIGYDAFKTIQEGVNAVASGGTVNVYAGTYDEDVAINQPLSLVGFDSGTKTVRGPIGGSGSTIQVGASNVTIAGLTITRVGNNTTDWNNPGLNTAGISIQGQAISGALIRDNLLTGNRTGIDINNSNGHTIRNNVIDFNRTGLIFRNQTDNVTLVENVITNNWTVGVLFLDGSGGTNTPAQRALHSTFSNNNLSSNWYGQIVDRQSGGSLPAPATTSYKNFRGNWFGATPPVVTTANSTEPGYAAQIPVTYGGTATAPGGQPDIAGPASANFQYTPFLVSGADTDVETTPGRGTNGFQGVANTVQVSYLNQNGWVFFDDNPGTGSGSGGFQIGPSSPPLGTGSAFLTVDAQGRFALGVFNYNGTRADDLLSLLYGSFQNNNVNTVVAPSLQFDVDYDLNDAATAYQGRLVFEPYLSPSQGAVAQNVWQDWEARSGNWYGTRTTVTVNNGSVAQPCQPATPCTWTQILSLYPNAGVRNAAGSAVLFKAGGPWSPGFQGNVDNFRLRQNGALVTYNFQPGPQISINDVTHNEGDAGTTTYTFDVTLSEPSSQTVTVDYATANDTANAPSDYTAVPTTTLTFNPGETSKPVTVLVTADTSYELNEQFFVNLSNVNANATILDAQGVGTITNDDAAPSFSINDVTHSEGNSGTTSYSFTVTKTGTTDLNSSVQFQTQDGTATLADNDYQSNTGTLSFGAADTTMPVTVLVNGDITLESNETFNVHLSTPVNATIADADGTGTINNDDCGAFSTVYVDAAWAGTPFMNDPDGPNPATSFGCDSFATIHDAINGVSAGGTIIVHAGTYKENPNASKAVTIQGPNAGIAGSAARGAEASVVTSGNQTAVFSVTASNVTIDGLLIDGDDPLVTGGALFSGEDTNVSYAVRPTGAINNLTLQNNIIKRVAIGLRGDTNPSQGNLITKNWFDSIGNFDFGYCVSIRNNFYANVTNNKMTRAWTGVHINNHNGTGGPASFNITGNEIHSYAGGILYWLQFNGATGATITGNTITAESGPVANNFGVLMVSIQNAVNPTFTNNTIANHNYGVGLFNVPTTNTITINSDTISGSTLGGVFLTDNLNFNPIGTTNFLAGGPGAASTVNVTSSTIANNAANGVKVEGQTNSQTLSVSGATISGSSGSKGVELVATKSNINMTGSTLTGFATGFALGTSAGAVGHFNRIISTTNAIDNPNNQAADLTNNWWGCNAGPGNSGCGSVNGTGANFSPWIVLGVSGSPNPIAPSGTSTVTADMTHNSANGVPSVSTFIPQVAVSFGATNGTMLPTSGTITSGQATSTFTSTNPSTGSACADVDSEHACTTINVVVTITATAGANGSISPSGAVTMSPGSNQTFLIHRNPGYQIADVLVDGVSVGAVNNYTFSNVNANHTINASFSVAPSVVTVTPATSPNQYDNDYTRINDAVQAAFSGQTIKLLGNFNWTEVNAAASWALGSDGQTGGSFSDDDYSIVPPAPLNNVTFTATNLGDGTIQGPGDLAGVDLEGVFAFFRGQNQNWTISNIRFLDFDLSIGMFATSSSDFNNTHLVNNYIRIARDLNAVVAPVDVNQNIGIHFSFGTNQTISGNTIEIQGDGLSDGSDFATDVAMQSNTSGGNVYEGLQITNNTIRVLHAQNAGSPQIILGIWENAHAHSSNITVSGNTFVNQDAGNSPAVNLQRAFRVTSHSSNSTTVTYSNNTVSGANIGFQWISGSNFTGNQPVVVSGNTIADNDTGVLVQSQGLANLKFNRIVGNNVGLNNVDGVVTAENNWWGCNAGPGNSGCDTVSGTADFNPWIKLNVSASPTSVAPGGTSTATADMTHNSDNAVPTGVTALPLPDAAFTATNGTMLPTINAFTSGQSQSTFTSSNSSSGSACGQVDNEQQCAPITIALPSFSIDDVTIAEGNAGTTSFTFTITKTGAGAASVDYATVNGTAIAPADYTAIPTTTLSFLSADLSKQVTVLVNGDALAEPDENFTVHLSNAVNATISDADGLGTITNDDSCAAFSTVYVDDSWAGTSLGDDPDGAGPATVFGCDSFATIQGGATAVTAGGTVIVHDGTYTENVTITKAMTLKGAQFGVDARGRVATESIVSPAVGTSPSFTVAFNGLITIDGFTFSGGPTGASGAIFTSVGPNNNMQISNNRFISYPAAAIWMNRGGSDITIDKNVMDGSNLAGSGQAIFANGPQSYTGLYVTNNNIINNPGRAGFFVDGNHNVGESATRAPSISGNLFDNNQVGMNLGSRSFGSLGTPTLGAYAGTISNNTFSNHAFDGVQGGIQHVLVSGNTFSSNGRYGLSLTSFGNAGVDRGGQNSRIVSNVFTGNGSGVNGPGAGLFFSGTQGAGLIETNHANFNRIIGNNVGVQYGTSVAAGNNATIDIENNWWGCNFGPGAGGTGCTGTTNGTLVFAGNTGVLDSNPWIVLGASASPNPIAPGGNSTVTADMTRNSDNLAPSVTDFVPQVAVNFSATNGTIAPPTGTITSGQSQSTFTSTSTANGQACATVNNQQTCTSVTLALPSFSIDDVTHAEGNPPGTTAYIFTVTKTGATGFSSSVQFQTVDGTATVADNDYAANSGTLNFGPSDTTMQVTVQVNHDFKPESDEAFTVHLFGEVSATISDADGTGTIQNDDNQPNVVYVDDDFTGPIGSDPDGAGPATAIGYDAFKTIQEGVNGVAAAGTVNVAAGNYPENVTVPKSLSLLGPNASVNPNTGTRAAEAVVRPAITETSLQASTSGTIFRLGTGSGHIAVTVKGFTLDGNNPLLTGGRVLNGVGIHTGAAIVNSVGSFDSNPGAFDTTMVVQNNIIQNLERYGVLADNVPARTPSAGTDISFNKIDNLPSGNNFGGGRGRGIAFEENLYGTATFNVMTRVNVGWQDDNYNLASPGSATLIDHNQIHTYHRGIFHNLQYQDATAATITNNQVFAETNGDFPATTTNFGVELASIQSAVGVTVTNNNSTGNVYGILIWNVPTTNTITVSGGTMTGNQYGVLATMNDPQFGVGSAGRVLISGVTVSNATVAGMAADGAGASMQVTGSTITGSAKGVIVRNGAVANTITGNSIHDNTGLGIDLGDDGVTANDPSDADSGGNNLQNFPIIGSALVAPNSISGTLNSAPGQTFTIHLYANPACDPSGNGEGQTLIGSTTANTNGSGDAVWSLSPGSLNAGDFITATATDAAGNTSEFSACFQARAFTPGTITFSQISSLEANSDHDVNLIVSRTGGSDGAVSVEYNVTDGTATIADNDYSVAAPSGTLTWLNGDASDRFITVKIKGDLKYEATETVLLTLSNPTGGASIGGTNPALSITNDDTTPSFSIDDVTHNEGNSGTTAYVFTVTKTGSTALNADVNFQTADGSATLAGNDYQSQSGSLTFLPGDTTKTVTVLVNGDTTVEPNENFSVNLSGATNAAISDNQGVGTITNDDTDVSVAVSPSSVLEDGAANLVYTFTRSGNTVGPLTVNFSVAGTATFNSDYTQSGAASFSTTSGTVIFTAGSSTATVTIDPTTDATVEPDESVILTVAAAAGYGVGSPSAATGTITNDDTDVSVAVSPASVLEDGATNLVYTFTRNGNTTGTLTVNFTMGGTANFNTDYAVTGAAISSTVNGTVTFGAGSTTATVTIDPTSDTVVEPDETVILTVASGTGYNVGSPSTATGTIANDDSAVSVAVSPATVQEDGATNLVYTFTRNGNTTGALTANFTVAGTATFNTDYTQTGAATFSAASGTVTFAAGSPTATVTIDPTADAVFEPNETVILSVAAGTGYDFGSPSSASGTIVNDDTDVSVAVSPSAVLEDGATNLVYTFTRNGPTTGALTANFTVAGTATFNTDYTPVGAATFGATNGTVVFAAGRATATVTIDPTTDATVEPDETVILTVASGTGYGVGSPNSATGTILNDDLILTPTVSILQFDSASYNTTEGSFFATITVQRLGDTTGVVSVDYATPDDSAATSVVPCATVSGIASPRCDFTTAVGTLRWAAGDSAPKTFIVLISADNYVEGPESLNLTLSNPVGNAQLGSPSTATLTIADVANSPTQNIIDDPADFVRQHYHDFLNREPDQSGFDFWVGNFPPCGGDAPCIEVKRINVSGAFYLSIEFQGTGYFVERLYKSSYGNATGTSTDGGPHQVAVPIVKLSELLPDTQEIGRGVVVLAPGWEAALEANKVAFTEAFVQRPRFLSAYPLTMTPAQFVDALNANAGNPLSAAERNQLVSDLTGGVKTRAQVLRAVTDDQDLINGEFNRAFVLMQYFGYLRRNPNAAPDIDHTGYDFWLKKLNSFNGDFVQAEMVKAFLSSLEYRQRSGAN